MFKFETPKKSFIPWNFLPTALAALQSSETRKNDHYQLIPVPLKKADGTPRETTKIAFEGLSSLKVLQGKMAALDPDADYFLSPLCKSAQESVLSTSENLENTEGQRTEEKIIGIIDVGIAFWNKTFLDDLGVCRFVDIGFMDLDSGKEAVSFIGQEGIAKYCTQMQKEGEKNVLRDLGTNHPKSTFARQKNILPLYRRHGFSHGTAMAHLAAPERTKLMGLELPVNAVMDSTGDTLTSIVGIAIEALAKRAQQWGQAQNKDVSLGIVLSFGFMGGPHDGQHPIARQISHSLNQNKNVTLFVPMGNHRQDKIHATLGNAQKGDVTDELTWFIEPHDYSTNSIELCVGCDDEFLMTLTNPDGKSAEVVLHSNEFSTLTFFGKVIGAVSCRKIRNNQFQMRLSIAPTASRCHGDVPAPSGRWKIKLHALKHDLHDPQFWVLRDDAAAYLSSPLAKRQSYFMDKDYRHHDVSGNALMGDDAGAKVKRSGSASIMATCQHDRMISVAALQKMGQNITTAWYCGAYKDPNQSPGRQILVDPEGISSGRLACANGGKKLFSVSGTSAAAALAAKEWSIT